MPKKTYKPGEIIGKLRGAEVRLSQGASVAEVVSALAISKVTAEADYVPKMLPSVRSIISDDRWRLTGFDEPGYGELFDLKPDPGEQHNRYFGARFSGRRQELCESHIRAFMRHAETRQHRALLRIAGLPQRVAPGLDLHDDILQTGDV